MLSPQALGFLNVVTNVAYLFTAHDTFSMRLYNLSAWFIAATIASITYHVCLAFGTVCIGGDVHQLRLVDHIVANIAIAQVMLFISTYDLVSLRRARRILHDMSVPISHTRAVSKLPDHALIKSRASDFVGVLYVLAVLYAALVAFDTIYEYVIVVGVGVAIIFGSSIVHWELKSRNEKDRWSYPLLALGFGGIAVAILLFLLPGELGTLTHPIWHVAGAITANILIRASTRHIQSFSLFELFALYT